jgi:hypothetical protein
MAKRRTPRSDQTQNASRTSVSLSSASTLTDASTTSPSGTAGVQVNDHVARGDAETAEVGQKSRVGGLAGDLRRARRIICLHYLADDVGGHCTHQAAARAERALDALRCLFECMPNPGPQPRTAAKRTPRTPKDCRLKD